jgi:hypothetical protein
LQKHEKRIHSGIKAARGAGGAAGKDSFGELLPNPSNLQSLFHPMLGSLGMTSQPPPLSSYPHSPLTSSLNHLHSQPPYNKQVFYHTNSLYSVNNPSSSLFEDSLEKKDQGTHIPSQEFGNGLSFDAYSMPPMSWQM